MTENWNVDSLKDYTDALFAEFGKGVNYRFEAIKQAIEKSDGYAAYRDLKQNEFRKALDDQNLTFARKADQESLEKQFEIWMSGMKQLEEANFGVAIDKITKCEKAIERIENTKRGNNAIWPWVITIIMTLTTMGLLIITFIK